MRKPLVALFSRDTRMICELPAQGKGRFRFAVCEAIDEIEEFFSLNRAAALVADFRSGGFAEGPEVLWLASLRRRFADMSIVVLTSADASSFVDFRDDVCLVCCDDDRQAAGELLGCLIGFTR